MQLAKCEFARNMSRDVLEQGTEEAQSECPGSGSNEESPKSLTQELNSMSANDEREEGCVE